MPANTTQDFLRTANENNFQFYCPACGLRMGITRIGTYQMQLTERSRGFFNNEISIYRNFLQEIEARLMQLNLVGTDRIGDFQSPFNLSPETIDGEGRLIVGLPIGEQIGSRYDKINIDSILHKVPPLSDLQKLDSNESKQKLRPIIEYILEGFEPPHAVGPLTDLMFEQAIIKTWIENAKWQIPASDNFEGLNVLVEEVMPYAFKYLVLLARHYNKSNDDKEKSKIIQRVARAIFIGALMFGHNSSGAISSTEGLVEHAIPFNLPKRTTVTTGMLRRLMTSYLTLEDAEQLGISSEFVAAVKSGAVASEDVLRLADESIKNVVHFACMGDSGRIPVDIEDFGPSARGKTVGGKSAQSQSNELTKERCGWFPKDEETHPVVFLGGPGVGKSTVMLTGLMTMLESIKAARVTMQAVTDRDLERITKYEQQYKEGNLPKPTPEGSRESIEFLVRSTRKGARQDVRFVFTDIPGEIVSQGLLGKGTHPVVTNLLRTAETIVFFYDMTVEPSILNPLQYGNKTREDNLWMSVVDNYNDMVQARVDRVTGTKKEIVKRMATMPQQALLLELIEQIREFRGADRMQKINFVCVLPKIDLFTITDRTQQKAFFMTPFFDALKETKLMVRSIYGQQDDDGYEGYRSKGGIGTSNFKESSTTASWESIQEDICRKLSDKAIECLLQIGNALGVGVEDAEREALILTVSEGLVGTLQANFENIYLLPVSAQGRNMQKLSEKSGTSNVITLGHTPNQKLSEYVFLLPIALALLSKKN